MGNHSSEEYLHSPIQFWPTSNGIEWEYPTWTWGWKGQYIPQNILGKFVTHPKDVRKYDSSHRSDSRNHGEYWSKQFDDPYRYNQSYKRDRSRSVNRFQRYESRTPIRFWNNSRNRLTAHAHQVVFTLEIDAHVGVMNIQVLIHRYATCHVLFVAVHNRHLQIANVLHR